MEYVCPNIFFPINPNGVLTIAWLLLDICGINSIVIWNVEKTHTHFKSKYHRMWGNMRHFFTDFIQTLSPRNVVML